MTPAGRLGRLRQAVWQQTDTSPSVPDGGSGTDHLALITFAARVGARALVSGASAAETTGMILRLAWGCGVPCQVDVTFTSITVSISESVDSGPLTVMRTVPQLDRDYAQLGELERLVAQVTEGRMTLAHAEEELDHFTRHRMQYRTWVLRVAAFGQGAGICALLGGDLREMLLAGFATLLIELTLRMLARRRATYFTGQVVAGAIPMIIGVGLMYGRTHGLPELWLLRPSLIAAAGMVTMLAGLGVVGAAQDALDGYFVTATARVGDLLMRTGGLILGVVGVLWISLQLGIPAYLTAEALRPPSPCGRRSPQERSPCSSPSMSGWVLAVPSWAPPSVRWVGLSISWPSWSPTASERSLPVSERSPSRCWLRRSPGASRFRRLRSSPSVWPR